MSELTAFQPDVFQNNAFQVEGVAEAVRKLPYPYHRFPHGTPASSVYATRSSGQDLDEFNLAFGGGG